MSAKSLVVCVWSAAVLAALAGCGTMLTPDARQGAPANPATQPGGAPVGGRGARGPQIPASIGSAMGDMQRMLAAIKAEAADETKIEQTLKDLAIFERDVAISKTLTPGVFRVAADKRDKAPADYRAAMTAMQRTLLDLEDAVVAKKADDIKKLIQKLEEAEKAGHAEFGVDAGG